MLNSLIRIAGAIEGSMYRAIRELERMKTQLAAWQKSVVRSLNGEDYAQP